VKPVVPPYRKTVRLVEIWVMLMFMLIYLLRKKNTIRSLKSSVKQFKPIIIIVRKVRGLGMDALD